MKESIRAGIVIQPSDLMKTKKINWIETAANNNINLIGIHCFADELISFINNKKWDKFYKHAKQAKIEIEFELHALSFLLPRTLFGAYPGYFRMDKTGKRDPGGNMCVTNEKALSIVKKNAEELARMLPATTNRYYFWADDAAPWCECPACKKYSPSDQNLIYTNAILEGIRKVDTKNRLAYLAYLNSLPTPDKVKPGDGIFLEYAPIKRCYKHAIDDPSCATNKEHVEGLKKLIAFFGTKDAQVLEYWLDASMFSNWKRPVAKLPFSGARLNKDLKFYVLSGFSRITNFACWLDDDYIECFGVPPVKEYGTAVKKYLLS